MIEKLVSDWLFAIVAASPSEDDREANWLYGSGLLEEIRNGHVVTELAL